MVELDTTSNEGDVSRARTILFGLSVTLHAIPDVLQRNKLYTNQRLGHNKLFL